VAIDNAVTIMDFILVVGFAVLAVTLLAPVMVTARSRWLVPVLAAVIVAVVVPSVASSAANALSLVALVAATLIMAAAQNVTLRRLLVVGGVGVVLTLMSVCALLSVGIILGGWLTQLAGNPPVNGADTDLSIALTATLIGLAFSAAVLVVLRAPAPTISTGPTDAVESPI
jgi:hypothetical protein